VLRRCDQGPDRARRYDDPGRAPWRGGRRPARGVRAQSAGAAALAATLDPGDVFQGLSLRRRDGGNFRLRRRGRLGAGDVRRLRRFLHAARRRFRRPADRGGRAHRVPQAEAVAGKMRTQVGIVGAGPAGLFLSLLLHRAGIDCVVLESRSRDYVESRVRAGVLEQGTVDLMDELGAGERLHREGMLDPRLDIRFSGGIIHIDLPVLTPGKIVTVYGQQEVVKDLIAARLQRGGTILFEAEASHIEGLTGETPTIHFTHEGEAKTLECDIVAGCDGFHGICRAAIPENLLTVYDRIFPFGWLGILSESKP